jgi:small subunit ribosomal protein S1
MEKTVLMDKENETVGPEMNLEGGSEESESNPMDVLLDEGAIGIQSVHRGQIRDGTIARVTQNEILVDIGAKSEGIIASHELEELSDEERAALQEGKEVTVYVLKTGGSEGTIILSLRRAEEEQDWRTAESLFKSKKPYEGIIAGYNKGGLIAKLGHLRGFVPASQIGISRRRRTEGETPDKRWGKMVGETIVTKVIEVDRNRNRLILSERAAAREAREILKERLIAEIEPGEIRTGYVISLADFGAFIDIGGADGLVHLSEISWKRISHPRDILKIGEEVQVKVLGIDREQKRISLSMRELQPNPWDLLVEHYHEGQLVEGEITKLTKFGAFACLVGLEDYDIEGLIHISEMSDRRIMHPREVMEEGQRVTLRIIKIDSKRRRIGLSLKKVDSPEYAEMDWQMALQEMREAEGEATKAEVMTADEAAAEGGGPIEEAEISAEAGKPVEEDKAAVEIEESGEKPGVSSEGGEPIEEAEISAEASKPVEEDKAAVEIEESGEKPEVSSEGDEPIEEAEISAEAGKPVEEDKADAEIEESGEKPVVSSEGDEPIEEADISAEAGKPVEVDKAAAEIEEAESLAETIEPIEAIEVSVDIDQAPEAMEKADEETEETKGPSDKDGAPETDLVEEPSKEAGKEKPSE